MAIDQKKEENINNIDMHVSILAILVTRGCFCPSQARQTDDPPGICILLSLCLCYHEHVSIKCPSILLMSLLSCHSVLPQHTV